MNAPQFFFRIISRSPLKIDAKKNAEKYFSALFSHTAKFFCGAWQTQARQEQ